jgi:hypothetical protein
MAAFPLVNGMYFSWADVETTIVTATGQVLPMVGYKAINYKDSLSKQLVRGTASVAIGLTKGKYEASGDIEMWLPQANLLITTMGPGWKQVPISFQVSYLSSGPLGAPGTGLPQSVITDTIPGCFLTEIDASQSESDEGLSRKFTLKIPGQILWNGQPSMIDGSFVQVAIA